MQKSVNVEERRVNSSVKKEKGEWWLNFSELLQRMFVLKLHLFICHDLKNSCFCRSNEREQSEKKEPATLQLPPVASIHSCVIHIYILYIYVYIYSSYVLNPSL